MPSDARQESELFERKARAAAESACHERHRHVVFEAGALASVCDAVRFSIGAHAFQTGDKVDVKEGPAKFAVGNGFETDRLLHCDNFADALVLDRSDRIGWQFAARMAQARLFEPVGTKQAADVFGAKWRANQYTYADVDS